MVRETTDAAPVFISYARSASRSDAEALQQTLSEANVAAFLDIQAMEPGDAIPDRILDALLGARVLVVLTSETYFTRRYCLEELAVGLAAYRTLMERGARPGELAEAVAALVIALPAGADASELEQLPPEVRTTNWPAATDTGSLRDLIMRRLDQVTTTIGGRLDRLGELAATRQRLRDQVAVPEPTRLRGLPVYHWTGFPRSLGDAFVGRSRELWAINAALTRPDASAAVALEGTGGFGKTRLALEYVHRYATSAHRGGVFWIDAGVSEDLVEAQQHGILTVLRPDTPSLETMREHGTSVAGELARALRAQPATDSVLYVVDGIPDQPGTAPPEPTTRWCPAPEAVSLLVTSRTARSPGEPGIHGLPVRELPGEAAEALLTRGAGGSGRLHTSEWRRVVDWVGAWPLALELLNAALRAGALSAGELLDLIAGVGPVRALDDQMEALRTVVPDGALRGATEALEISFCRLPRVARAAALRLAWLSANPIPVALLTAIDLPPIQPRPRALLRSRSFVTEAGTSGIDFYGRIHPVVGDYLRHRDPSPERRLERAAAALVGLLPLPEMASGKADWAVIDACRPHAEEVFERSMTHAQASADIFVELGGCLGKVLQYSGRFDLATAVLQRTLALARRVLGPDHPRALTTASLMADTLHLWGHWQEARELLEGVVEALTRILGPENKVTLSAKGSLAMMLEAQGERARGEGLRTDVMRAMLRHRGGDRVDLLTLEANAAAVRDDVAGLERVLGALSRELGEESRETLRVKGLLGSVLHRRGEMERARGVEEAVLQVRRRVLGEEDVDTLWSTSNLAWTLFQLGDLERAAKLLEPALEPACRIQGPNHPETLRLASNLVAILRARDESERALRLIQRHLGQQHDLTRATATQLANELHRRGDLGRAVEIKREILASTRRLLGNEHPDTLRAMANLASTLIPSGAAEEARVLCEAAVEAMVRVLGDEHPDTLRGRANLASALVESGEIDRGRQILEKLLEVRLRVLGPDHADTARTMWSLGAVMSQQGERAGDTALQARALTLRARALRILARRPGPLP